MTHIISITSTTVGMILLFGASNPDGTINLAVYAAALICLAVGYVALKYTQRNKSNITDNTLTD